MRAEVKRALKEIDRCSLKGFEELWQVIEPIYFRRGHKALYIDEEDETAILLLPPGATSEDFDAAYYELVELVTAVENLVRDGLLLKVTDHEYTGNATLFYEDASDFSPRNGGSDFYLGPGLMLRLCGDSATVEADGKTSLSGKDSISAQLAVRIINTLMAVYCPTAGFKDYVGRGCRTESRQALRYALIANWIAFGAVVLSPFVTHFCVKTTIADKQFDKLINRIDSVGVCDTIHCNGYETCEQRGGGDDAPQHPALQQEGKGNPTGLAPAKGCARPADIERQGDVGK